MNSTEENTAGLADQDRFLSAFLSVAEEIRRDVGDLFPLGPDNGSTTYYRNRRKTRMRREDFEVEGLLSLDNLEIALRQMWEEQGLTALASLAPAIVDAARALHGLEEETDEISPFIYVMF